MTKSIKRRNRPPSVPSALSMASLALMISVAIAGCAQVKPAGDYERARQLILETTGASEVFDPEKPAITSEIVSAMLADGLSLAEAERLALLNNRELQGALYDIGIAHTDWVQSGLFSNPSLAFSVQFPEGGGRSDLQATIAQNIVDLWQIPLKRQIAGAARDAAILRVARQAGILVAETRTTYFQAVAASLLHGVTQENLALVRKSYEAVKALREAGAASELDENLARGQALTAQLADQNARLDAANFKRRLASLLSLEQSADTMPLIDDFPEPADTSLDAELLIEVACENRLDLKSLAAEAESAEVKLRLEWRKIFPDISIGPFLERTDRRALPGRNVFADTARASIANGALTAPDIQSRSQRDQARRQEIDALLGPALTMTLPIFDQNQAQIAKAGFAYAQALKQLEDQSIRAAQDIRIAVDRRATAAAILKLYEGEIVPQAEKNLEFANTAFTAGRTSILALIEAQRALLEARRGEINARADQAGAGAALEAVVGCRPASIRRNDGTSQPSGAFGEVNGRGRLYDSAVEEPQS